MVEQASVTDTSDDPRSEKKRVLTTEQMATRKQQMMASLSKFIAQLKDGCEPSDVKPVCFSAYCQRNVLVAHKLQFSNDKELMKFALSTLSASEDPASLICNRDTFIISRKRLMQFDLANIIQLDLISIEAFCCSFGRNLTEEDFTESQAVLQDTERSTGEMARLQIDFKAAQMFFNLVKQSQGILGCQSYIIKLVQQLSDQVPLDREFHDDMKVGMVARGLLLILSYADVSSVSWHTVTVQCLKLFYQVTN